MSVLTEPVYTHGIADQRPGLGIFEQIRLATNTLLRAEELEFDPPPIALGIGALTRPVERVEVKAARVPIDGTQAIVDQLNIVAEDVRVRLSLRGVTVQVGTAVFEAKMSQQQLSIVLPLPPGVARLSVTPRGFTFHTVTGLPIYTAVALRGEKIRVSPSAPKLPGSSLIEMGLSRIPFRDDVEQLMCAGFSFPVPQLPGNAEIRKLDLYDGHVIASGTLDISTYTADETSN